MRVAKGKVWLVGAGPGNPDLITVRGLELLKQADVVLYDALSHAALLDHCRPDAELRSVGKRGGSQNPSQEWITRQLIELARAGKCVVRLKGGDVYIFARGAEEALALAQAGIPFEVVPGISSPIGTSAYAGIPLTHRELSNSVTFITGSDREGVEWSEEAWRKLATATSTICVLMGMRRLPEITRALIAGGRPPNTPAAVIYSGARPQQRVVTGELERIAELAAEAGLTNPAVVVIGEVVKLRQELSWYEEKPLFGKRILVPRPEHQARETAAKIREFGAEPILFPVIELCDPPDPSQITRAIAELDQYDWCLFTSANGVQRFFERLRGAGRDSRAFGSCQVGAIGPKTAAALGEYGIVADAVATEFRGEGLAEAVLSRCQPRRVLIPRALVARDELPRLLEQGGSQVDVVPVYETRPIGLERAETLRSLFEMRSLDIVMFTSSSTVSALLALLGDRASDALRPFTVASIGPITTESLTKAGVRVDVTAREFTVDGLLEALSLALPNRPP